MNQQGKPTFDAAVLREEYFHLQNVVESSDAKSLTIKAWSVSVVGAIAGSGAFLDRPRLLLFAAFVSFMFWLIDASWKTFQVAHYRRIEEIEKYMRGETAGIDNLQMNQSWRASFRATKLRRYLRILFWYHILLPHGAMFFMLLAVYLGWHAVI